MSEITYTKHGDYYLPDLKMPNEETRPIGIWGQRHLSYLKEHKRIQYTILLTSGKLNTYLADINEQAENLFSRLVKEMADAEGITEQLKAEDQMEWVGQMNNLRCRVEEIIFEDIVYKY